MGFLTFKDLQNGFSKIFDVSFKRNDLLEIFKEIDSDKDGIVKLKEF